MWVCPRCRSIYATKVQWCGIDNAALVHQTNDPLVGSELERYRIVEPLGVGGMGCVYRASHTFIDREYAIKVLYGDFAGDPKFRERFRREAKSIGQIRHPNIVFVEDFGTTSEGLTFLAMEMIHGRTLEQVIKHEAPFSPVRAAQIMRQVVAGLGAAHSLGFVHRDVKPSNIMLSQQGGLELVKILDFGTVSMRSVPVDQRLTSVGHIIGTPTYMAPEQSQDPNVGPPADLYAAGVILFEMLTGKPPFVGKARAEVLIKHIIEEPPRAPVSRGLEKVVAALLKKLPDERPQAAHEVIRMLDGLGLDLAIVSDPPHLSQAALPTSRVPRNRVQVDFHSQATRAQTPTTDPPTTDPTQVDPVEHSTARHVDDLLAFDTFPVLQTSEVLDWQAWATEGRTDPIALAHDFESAPTTRNAVPDLDGDFCGPTIPVDTVLELDSQELGRHSSDDLTPLISDDRINTHPADLSALFDKPQLRLGASEPVSIRDDGPTRIDFLLKPEIQATTSGDLVHPAADGSRLPPPTPEIGVVMDTAKTLSDGDDVVVTPADVSRLPPPTPEIGVVMDTAKTLNDGDNVVVTVTLAPTLRDSDFEDSEDSLSLRARVIPVLDSGGGRTRTLAMALITLALMLTMVVAAVVHKSKSGRASEIESSSAQPRASQQLTGADACKLTGTDPCPE